MKLIFYIYTTIKKHLPSMIASRISALSSSKEVFDKEKPFYDTALKRAGYSEQIKFVEQTSSKKNRLRRRKVIWFNPPYSQNVKTNVAGKFLSLVNKHFGSSQLRKYFNRQTIKVSYSTMANMENIISGHNLKVIKESTTLNNPGPAQRTCNCRTGIDNCPLSGNCLATSSIYQAKVSSESESTKYIGLASTTFKDRYRNHVKSFNHKIYQSDTRLSKHIWHLKSEKKEYEIEWSILMYAPAYHPARKKCDLCLTEKVLILTSDNVLNGRTEILNRCQHKTNYPLCNT